MHNAPQRRGRRCSSLPGPCKKSDAIVRQTDFVALPMLVQASAFKTLLSVRGADGKMLSVKL